MALRQGGRVLARSLMQAKSLPTRGGGGGPIRYADAPNKQLPLWDELWWDDGLYHSQPVLDGTLEPQVVEAGTATRHLGIALAVISGSIYTVTSLWTGDSAMTGPQEYPPGVKEAFTRGDRVNWETA